MFRGHCFLGCCCYCCCRLSVCCCVYLLLLFFLRRLFFLSLFFFLFYSHRHIRAHIYYTITAALVGSQLVFRSTRLYSYYGCFRSASATSSCRIASCYFTVKSAFIYIYEYLKMLLDYSILYIHIGM